MNWIRCYEDSVMNGLIIVIVVFVYSTFNTISMGRIGSRGGLP